MKKALLIIALCIVVPNGCKYIRDQKPSPEYMKRAEFAQKEYNAAAKQAYNNDPAGYLKLYEMARNDNNVYVADWSEIANEELHLLLYYHTELWIKTFSKVELEKFKDFFRLIETPHTPEGISREQFKETILINLEKVRGDDKEMELVGYILGLYNRKRRE